MAAMIEIEDLGKRYLLGGQDRRYRSLREDVMNALRRPFQRTIRRDDDEFWALRHVDLEVREGEVLGLIGANGAGKSTLLKLLSRITRPTEGRARLYGRVGSLLEVGTGFHPELTGEENIYLSGAILGMRRAETRRKFDEIVAFADVASFLGTPVKHYSSGMFVRLGFAVAAHLEPEILLIDEVLAVGDAAFQKKCIGKMSDVAGSGRTVVFVSHNMTAVQSLCHRAVLLDRGGVAEIGDAGTVCARYLHAALDSELDGSRGFYHLDEGALERQRGDDFRFTSIELESPGQGELGPRTGDPLVIRLSYRARRQIPGGAFWIRVSNARGLEVLRLSTMPISGFQLGPLHDEGVGVLRLAALPLVSGEYRVDVRFARERVDWVQRVDGALRLQVRPGDVYGSDFPLDGRHGMVVVDHTWEHHGRT